MRFFKVHSKYPDSETINSDHVVGAKSEKAAREYVEHRWSPAYGYSPEEAPQLVKLEPISRRTAEDMAESGCIDWSCAC